MDYRSVEITIKGIKYGLIKKLSIKNEDFQEIIKTLQNTHRKDNKKFSEALNNIMNSLNIKTVDLANQMHSNPKSLRPQISRWKNGHNFPSNYNQKQLIEIFKNLCYSSGKEKETLQQD